MDKIDLELTQSLSQGIATIFNVLGAIGAMVAGTSRSIDVLKALKGYFHRSTVSLINAQLPEGFSSPR
jgi:hypothetical protein